MVIPGATVQFGCIVLDGYPTGKRKAGGTPGRGGNGLDPKTA